MSQARNQRASKVLLGCLLLTPVLGCVKPPTIPEPVTAPFDQYPAWSPDGRSVAYSHFAPSPTDSFPTGLYVLDLVTRSRTRLVSAWPTTISWFGDSKRLVFAAAEFLEVSVETGELSVLLPHGGWYPHLSPGDTTLAFDTNEQDPQGASAIWLADLATGTRRDISVHGTGEWRHPRWSPDGRWILHYRYGASGSNGTPELFKMDPTGKTAVRLTNDTVWDIDACWSPDGSQIAWTHGDRLSEIWLMAADGTNARFLHRGSQPSFSPDGLTLVFVDPDATGGSLRRINVDGTEYAPL